MEEVAGMAVWPFEEKNSYLAEAPVVGMEGEGEAFTSNALAGSTHFSISDTNAYSKLSEEHTERVRTGTGKMVWTS